MFLLIFIYYFKNVLSMNDIQTIFNPLTGRYYNNKDSKIKLEQIYDEIFRLEKEQTDALTKDIVRKMTKARESFDWVDNDDDREFLTEFAFMCMLCFDVYMRKHIIEKIIDNSLAEAKRPDKNEKGGKKEAARKEAGKKAEGN